MDALAIRRAVIARHSSASIVARRFALDHPERVAGLVLEGSFVKLGEGAAQFGARLASLEDPIPREFARDFAGATFGRSVSKEFAEAMIEESLTTPARVWRETFASLLNYDDSVEVGKLDVATLVMWGDQDAIIDRAATDALARSMRDSKLVVYEGIGHTPHWEDPTIAVHHGSQQAAHELFFSLVSRTWREWRNGSDSSCEAWFVHLLVEGLDQYFVEVRAHGAEILSPPADRPYGLREFILRTPDGHRMSSESALTRTQPRNAVRTPAHGAWCSRSRYGSGGCARDRPNPFVPSRTSRTDAAVTPGYNCRSGRCAGS